MKTRRRFRGFVRAGSMLVCMTAVTFGLGAQAQTRPTAAVDSAEPQQTPPAPATSQPAAGQTSTGARGGRGSGGLPPMNPIDENVPPPPLVVPGKTAGAPPSDAVVLFDGTDMSHWTLRDGSPARCKVEKREMVCTTGDESIVSKQTFTTAQVHLEYNVPQMEAVRDGKPNAQMKGNSGFFLHGSYEIQILDSYNNLNKTYPDGSNASLYRVSAPLVNVSRAPGEWQTYDAVIHAPTCEAGKLTAPGDITLFHNGVLVLDRVVPRVRNDMCEPGMREMGGPIMLQDHIPNGGPKTVMRFRNIWFRPLSATR
jgi:3-keto-disaccharide hydrolase